MPKTSQNCQGNWERRLLVAMLWSYWANHSRRNGNIANWGSCIPRGSKEAMAPALAPLPAHCSSFLGQNGSAIFFQHKLLPVLQYTHSKAACPQTWSFQHSRVYGLGWLLKVFSLQNSCCAWWNLNPHVLNYLSVSLCFERVFSGDTFLGRENFSYIFCRTLEHT